MKRVWNWTEIQRYHDEGHGFVECRKRFGFSHTAWVKAIKRGELRTADVPFRDRRRRYDWAEVQEYYDAGHTYRECKAHFGFCAEAWGKAVRRGELRARARSLPIPVLLLTTKSRAAVRRRLLNEGLLRNECSICGLNEWLGNPIVMHIDHINGVNDDHRLENLRMLCPNCHSQTPTYGGRNAKRRPSRLQDGGSAV
ncbi:MAG TPA: HNH endonuclease signature motif containing protein [Candidatus Baltobacteraceae bacterium]|nr:HNH endonuclease signature motif containing protein [Candidatus Baltobacteraceae bacterium]